MLGFIHTHPRLPENIDHAFRQVAPTPQRRYDHQLSFSHSKRIRLISSTLIHTLLLLQMHVLATVVLAKDRFDAIVFGVMQIGSDTTHASASRLDTFKNQENYVSAVASIILHSATKTKFLPSVDGVISDQ